MSGDNIDDEWIRRIQKLTAKWREETINGDPTPATQAAHTAVEAAEVLDIIVKAETYEEADEVAEGYRDVLAEELGDVVVAHLGTLSLLGYDAAECAGEGCVVPEGLLARSTRLLEQASLAADMAPHREDKVISSCLENAVFALPSHVAAVCDAAGLDFDHCVQAALDKNGAREWTDWQEGSV